MARNETVVAVSRPEAFAVLTDPAAYVKWVVGGRRLRGVDEGWPAPGAAFHHEVDMAPFLIRDLTRMVELVPNERVVLEPKARPAGTALVRITLDDVPGGTRVVMEEEPRSGPVRLLPRAVLDPLIHVRNAESLRRLKRLVEQRSPRRSPARH